MKINKQNLKNIYNTKQYLIKTKQEKRKVDQGTEEGRKPQGCEVDTRDQTGSQ